MPHNARGALAAAGLPFQDGLRVASHALISVALLVLMRALAPLGAESGNPHSTRFRPERLLICNKHLGGIELAKQARA